MDIETGIASFSRIYHIIYINSYIYILYDALMPIQQSM